MNTTEFYITTMFITFSENMFSIGGLLWIAFMRIHVDYCENSQTFSPDTTLGIGCNAVQEG